MNTNKQTKGATKNCANSKSDSSPRRERRSLPLHSPPRDDSPPSSKIIAGTEASSRCPRPGRANSCNSKYQLVQIVDDVGLLCMSRVVQNTAVGSERKGEKEEGCTDLSRQTAARFTRRGHVVRLLHAIQDQPSSAKTHEEVLTRLQSAQRQIQSASPFQQPAPFRDLALPPPSLRTNVQLGT